MGNKAIARDVTHLKDGGFALVNTRVTAPVEVISGMLPYPDTGELMGLLGKVTDRVVAFDATSLAEEAGDPIATNVVMLGALTESKELPFGEETVLSTLRDSIRPRFLELNMRAFDLGRNAYRAHQVWR